MRPTAGTDPRFSDTRGIDDRCDDIMDYASLATTLISVAAGAVLGFLPTMLLERRRERRELLLRWDAPLLASAVDLVTAARLTEHLADQIEPGSSDDELLRRFDDEHQKVRVAVEHMRMLGTPRVQVAARNVLRAVYSRRVVMSGLDDPYPDDPRTPSERVRDELLDFYKTVRQQLQVRDADQVPRDSRASQVPREGVRTNNTP
jgi:hypothetical protein